MSASTNDPEIEAIEQLIQALEPLDDEARSRVLEYAFKRLGIDQHLAIEAQLPPSQVVLPAEEPPPPSTTPKDIRALRDEKQPKSANEMAAIVGYYLAEVAPESERKTAIGTPDIEKYFKQAQHPLPEAPGRTLLNAASAGYFDKVERGLYALNPVGHNLVAHSLPRSPSSPSPRKKRSKAATKTGKRAKKSRSTKRKPKK